MNLKELPSKKAVKLLTLLLTTLLIASASAAVYFSLTMDAGVTAAAPDVTFTDGNDSSGVASGHGTDGTWTMLTLEAYPNATLTYDQAINITNTGSMHTFRLRHGTINNDTSTSNFSSITFQLIAPNGTQYGGDFTYDNTDGNDTWDPPAPMSPVNIVTEEWAVKVITLAASGATASETASLVLYVDVTE